MQRGLESKLSEKKKSIYLFAVSFFFLFEVIEGLREKRRGEPLFVVVFSVLL